MQHNSRVIYTISTLSLILMLAAVGCAGSAGTAGGPAARRGPGPEAIYAGMWEGSFDITMVAGGMKLVLNCEEGVWSGEVLLDVEGESVSGPVERFEITEEGCSFATYIEEADVFFKGSVEEGVMKGTLTASVGGETIDGVFSITQK